MPGLGHAVYRFYQGLWSGLDWLYPPNCGGCGTRGTRWCKNCNENTRVFDGSICPRCGNIQASTRLCPNCLSSTPNYFALRSWAVYEGAIRQAIHRLKYKRDIALGEALSRPMIDCLHHLNWTFDLVVPVPLGVARLAERGYNQATLLARPVSLGMGLSYSSKALSRIRETRSQVDLTASERKNNVRGAFQARQELVNKRHVLVVDDVATTGSTLNECAGALLEAGAAQVVGFTLARASFA